MLPNWIKLKYYYWRLHYYELECFWGKNSKIKWIEMRKWLLDIENRTVTNHNLMLIEAFGKMLW